VDDFSEIDKHIYFEERNGYTYYIVSMPDGTTQGVWDLAIARAIVMTKCLTTDDS